MPANTTTTALNPTQSPNNADFISRACHFYWVFLSATLEPLLGTMHSKPTNNYDTGGTPCTEARLTPYQMKVPAGHKQCFYASGFRYFYQIDKITGQIVPNSMIQVSDQHKPPMCVGTHSYLEFINYVPQPQVNS